MINTSGFIQKESKNDLFYLFQRAHFNTILIRNAFSSIQYLNMEQQNHQNTELTFKVFGIEEDCFNEDLTIVSKLTASFDSLEISDQKTKKNSKKRKPIQKARTRTMKPNSRWTSDDRISYFKSVLKFNISKTNIGISWTYWKPQKIFNYISDEIQTKSSNQVKSFDQRMKKQFLEAKNIDLVPAAILQLQKVKQIDDQAKELLASHYKLEKQGSDYMRVIKQKINFIYQVDSLIQDLKKQMNMQERKCSKDQIFLDQE